VSSYLGELYAHQEWADAEHWRAFEAHPPALMDKAIHERLYHIHMVQHAFLWMAGPQTLEFALTKLDDFSDVTDLKMYARQGNAGLDEFLKTASPDRLEEPIEIPWFKPTLKISRRHALTQAVMHSHYHRGQNATRLRELGGVPPPTDFIVWLQHGCPAAHWS
jgi:uncharacterized damage-inducible protein DinB